MNVVFEKDSLIDLSKIDASEIFAELNDFTKENDIENNKISLNLGNLALNASQVARLKSLLTDKKACVEKVFSTSVNTQFALINEGFCVAKNIENSYTSGGEEAPKSSSPSMERFLSKISKEANEDLKKELGEKTNTLYITRTLRSGSTLSYDGNIVLIGHCHSGSEIIASGDITVWGILTGIAHAGAGKEASVCENSIRALRINAIQLRIANKVARKPDRGFVEKPEGKTLFAPEEARIEDGEIIIYTLNN